MKKGKIFIVIIVAVVVILIGIFAWYKIIQKH